MVAPAFLEKIRAALPDARSVARAAACLGPLLVALASASNAVDAAHDAGVVRTLGRSGAGLFHGPDLILAALGSLLPLGTRAFRAGAPSALLAGLLGMIAFELAFAALGTHAVSPREARVGGHAGGVRPRTRAGLSLIASLVVTLSPIVQFEATSPGSALLGACLALLPVAMGLREGSAPMPMARFGLLVGLAFAEEPLLGIVALVATLAVSPKLWSDFSRSSGPFFGGLLVGLAPMAWAAADSLREGVRVSWMAAAMGDRGVASVSTLSAFMRSELGYLELGLASAGFVVMVRHAGRERRLALAFAGVASVAGLGIYWGAAAGSVRFSALAIAGTTVLAASAASALWALTATVAQARIPFAAASATMMQVLFLAAPLRMLDETETRNALRGEASTHLWEELAFDEIPPRALLLISEDRLYSRVRAARAAGTMRPDIDVLPTFALDARSARTVIAHEPKLTSVVRDMMIAGTPSELSLSELSAARPLVLEFGASWDRGLARHLLPAGLFTRFEGEPRGISDRRIALDKQAVARDRVATAILPAKNPELVKLTVRALRIRAISTAVTGERESTSRALDDLRTFAPRDPILEELVRRVVLSKGYIEVADLDPTR